MRIYKIGTTRKITWALPDVLSSFVTVELSTNNGSTWSYITGSGVGNVPNTGEYSWTVPNSATVTGLIRISGHTWTSPIDGSEIDFSDIVDTSDAFTISASAENFGVVYKGNGSDYDDDLVVDLTDYNAGATVTVAANAFAKDGQIFGIWNTSANGSGTPYAPAATFAMPAADVTLYAQWAAAGGAAGGTPGAFKGGPKKPFKSGAFK